ncbi:MAG: beta strand repeat-containing protein, partial [Gammaproteobacteria bacterium]
ISTVAKSDGDGGSIDIIATDLVKLSKGGGISALTTGERATTSDTAGSVGGISVVADRVTVNNSAITVETQSGGDAGDISVVSNGKVNIKNRGHISVASTGERTADGIFAGDAGSIFVEGERVEITGSNNEKSDDEIRTGISIITSGEGNAGSISLVTTGQAVMDSTDPMKILEAPLVIDGGIVEVASLGTQKSDARNKAGTVGDISVSSDAMFVTNDGKVVSETDHDGNSGSVRVEVEKGLSINDGGRIEANSRGRQAQQDVKDGVLPTPYTAGRSGDLEIIVNDGNLLIDGSSKTGLFVTSGGNGLRGYGGKVGDIDVSVSNDVTIDGGFITQRTYGQSRTGDISVIATGDITTTGNGGMKVSSLKTLTDQDAVSGEGGDAGALFISADEVTLKGNSILESATTGSGNGGLIEIDARRLKVHGGRINASSQLAKDETQVTGNAGDIKLTVKGTLSVKNDSDQAGIIKSSANEKGDAGSIDITANRIVLSQGAIINSTTEGDGKAGIISLVAKEDVTIKGSSRVTTTSSGKRAREDGSDGRGGQINIEAQSLDMANEGKVVSNTNGDGDAGDIEISVVSEIRMTDNATISVDTFGTRASSDTSAGSGGGLSVTISDGNLFMSGQATISADSGEVSDDGINGPSCDCFGGKGGNIRIDVLRGTSEDGGNIYMDKGQIRADVYGQNDGGKIDIHADGSIVMDNRATIGVSARKTVAHEVEDKNGRGGDAGSITINAQDVTVLDRSLIESKTFGSGNSGSIVVNAGSLQVDGGRINASGALPISGVEGQSVPGRGGDIELNVDGKLTVKQNPTVKLVNGKVPVNGVVKAVANANGDGGKITINAGSLDVTDGGGIQVRALGEGNAGTISIVVRDSILVASEGSISAATTGVRDLAPDTAGKGGDISIEAASLEVSSDGDISASTASDGDAGQVSIRVSESILIKDGGKISVGTQGTRATSATSAGAGGDLVIEVTDGDLIIDGEQDIVGETETGLFASSGDENGETGPTEGGPGGSINLLVGGDVLLNGGSISATTLGRSNGGSIGIDSDGLQMMNGAVITAASTGAGDAGSVRIDAINSITLQQSAIRTSSSDAEGGDIRVSANDSIFLDGSEITAEANGNGGNLFIGDTPVEDRVPGGIPDFVVMKESLLVANARDGNGGNILITTNAFVADINSDIQASSERGLDGEVRIEAPNNITGSIVQLETPDFDISTLLASTCGPRGDEDVSRFAVRKSVVPPLPDDYRPSEMQWLVHAADQAPIEVNRQLLASASEIPCNY